MILRSFEICKYVLPLTSRGVPTTPRGLQDKMGYPGAQGDACHRNGRAGPSGDCMSWQEVTTGWWELCSCLARAFFPEKQRQKETNAKNGSQGRPPPPTQTEVSGPEPALRRSQAFKHLTLKSWPPLTGPGSILTRARQPASPSSGEQHFIRQKSNLKDVFDGQGGGWFSRRAKAVTAVGIP